MGNFGISLVSLTLLIKESCLKTRLQLFKKLNVHDRTAGSSSLKKNSIFEKTCTKSKNRGNGDFFESKYFPYDKRNYILSKY